MMASIVSKNSNCFWYKILNLSIVLLKNNTFSKVPPSYTNSKPIKNFLIWKQKFIVLQNLITLLQKSGDIEKVPPHYTSSKFNTKSRMHKKSFLSRGMAGCKKFILCYNEIYIFSLSNSSSSREFLKNLTPGGPKSPIAEQNVLELYPEERRFRKKSINLQDEKQDSVLIEFYSTSGAVMTESNLDIVVKTSTSCQSNSKKTNILNSIRKCSKNNTIKKEEKLEKPTQGPNYGSSGIGFLPYTKIGISVSVPNFIQ